MGARTHVLAVFTEEELARIDRHVSSGIGRDDAVRLLTLRSLRAIEEGEGVPRRYDKRADAPPPGQRKGETP